MEIKPLSVRPFPELDLSEVGQMVLDHAETRRQLDRVQFELEHLASRYEAIIVDIRGDNYVTGYHLPPTQEEFKELMEQKKTLLSKLRNADPRLTGILGISRLWSPTSAPSRVAEKGTP